ncbi:MAG: sigma-54-dependent Fis family transcriptional regulator [Lentisphaerae bacterium]|nr:sigma-54-dependent Fis family transcriptional regulator [Lentisphaerota bacterium]
MADTRPSLLIVDDEFNTRETLLEFLGRKFDTIGAANGAEAVKLLQQRDFDVVLTDLRMPEADGMSVLDAAKSKAKRPKCVMMTAYGSITDAVQAMKNGAFDFITKPIKLSKLEQIIAAALKSVPAEKSPVDDPAAAFAREVIPENDSGFVLPGMGKNDPMKLVYDTALAVAPGRSSVLLLGESGTGKEVIARYIHDHSNRTGLFVPVHCAALTATLLEDELFGHEKGAFTNAVAMRRGRFELADHGTIFLDEIGEIDAVTQVKLLRVLETRQFERLGGSETVSSDFRLIAATNRDLKAMVDQGEFREDLYYRLCVVDLHLPPLRERKGEIPALAEAFVREFAGENMKDVSGISPEALAELAAYDWPGNIRELRNCVEKMVVLTGNKRIEKSDVPEFAAVPAVNSGKSSVDPLNLENSEKELIRKALAECGNNRAAAARKLGISRRTLYRKLEELQNE